MFKRIKPKHKIEFKVLLFLIVISSIFTTYYNFEKNKKNETLNNLIDNVYLKKSLNHIIKNLEPKYERIKHRVKQGETFNKILENYSINKVEINKIKKSLQKKININNLNTKQIIQFNLDKLNDKIKEFTFQISNTQKISLKRNIDNDSFSEEILSIELNKKMFTKKILFYKVFIKLQVMKKFSKYNN